METAEIMKRTRRFALIALSVLVLEEIFKSYTTIFWRKVPLLGDILFMLCCWGITFLTVWLVEKNDLRCLGLTIKRESYLRYAFCAVIGLVLPAFFVRVDWSLITEFGEQIAYIGLPEEIFFRGYIMTRLCNWLGDRKGLVLSAVLFGLIHVTFLVSAHGLARPLNDVFVGFYTFLGGLLLGYVYLRAKSIVPCAIVRIAGNLYLGRL